MVLLIIFQGAPDARKLSNRERILVFWFLNYDMQF